MSAVRATTEWTQHDASFRVQFQGLESGRLHVRLGLEGELDIAVRRHLNDLYAAVIAMKPASVELDLSGVTFIDVCGFRALVTMQQDFADRRIQVKRGGSSKVVDRLQSLLATFDANEVERIGPKRHL